MKLNLGIWLPDKVFTEIRKTVHGYDVPLPVVDTGGAAPDHACCTVAFRLFRARFNPRATPCLRRARCRRYSKILNAVIESPGGLIGGQGPEVSAQSPTASGRMPGGTVQS